MIHEYSRTGILIGEEGLEKLNRASVTVFGIGGVGSHCIEALARSGVGRLTLVDHDTVSVTNINRQSIAYHSTVGRKKTEIMKERIYDINPEIIVRTCEEFVLPDNAEMFFEERPDYIIDAIDTVTAKLALVKLAARFDVPVISCMGTGNKLHADQFQISDLAETSVCPLCRVMRRELKSQGITHLKVLYSKEKPVDVSGRQTEEERGKKRSLPGSISFVPPVAGLLIAGEVIRDLLSKQEG